MEITDAFKYPLEKLVYFVAALIPGGVALLIYQDVSGTLFRWLVNLGFFGYRTKLSLLILTAFVIGHTLTNLLNALVTHLGYMVGDLIGRCSWWPSKSSFEYEDGPWRSIEWRNAIKQRLGAAAPNDVTLVTVEMMRESKKLAALLPPDQQPVELRKITEERISSILNDMAWSNLYGHYHQIVSQLQQRNEDEVSLHIRSGLSFNFVAAALYVLVSALLVPAVRHWWCIVPAAAWVFAATVEFLAGMRRLFDKWSTLQDQIAYLSSGRI
jgi:hypothetical protein